MDMRRALSKCHSYRGFVTRADNPFGYPSKDRSGRLEAIEEPHLGKLLAKCLGQSKDPAAPAPQNPSI